MYYRQESNQYIVDGTQFVIDGITYPLAWLQQASEQDLQNLGLVLVVTVGEFKDGKYYNNSEILNEATLTITSVAKPLIDVKTQALKDLNATAYSLLFPTDWMVIKAVETSTTVDPAWSAWRESIRTTVANAVTAINACTNVDEIAALTINWPADPNALVITEPVAEAV